jgi:hypothetical protein
MAKKKAVMKKFDSVPPSVRPISTRQAAQILGCTQANVRKLVREERIQSWLLSTRLSVVSQEEVEAFRDRTVAARKIGKAKGPPRGGFQPDKVPGS